ncbi:MAG: hypothetical protein L3K15_06150 [Thermoplasmata archaeon]|nr:hypothetical protein [Thermoplasmata archaeon]
MMRSLTSAETLVVGALLDPGSTSERARIRRSGLPTRTYETAARRLLASGVVYDRYLPNPVRFGRPLVTFALVHPFVERSDAVAARWVATPGSVVVWRGPEWIFGVFLPERTSAPSRFAEGLGPPGECGRAFVLTADSRSPQVPVYFDFEGAWSVLNELPRSGAYPRPLPGTGSEPEPRRAGALRARDRAAGRSLTERPLRAGSAPPGPRRRSSRYLDRNERRALREGVVEHRVLLDLARIPTGRGGAAPGVVLLHGRLQEHRTPEGLFTALLGRGQIAPFLFATDERRVLVGALAQAVSAPRPAKDPMVRRESVSGILAEFLEEIEVVRSSADGLLVPLDHRYDRIVEETPMTGVLL